MGDEFRANYEELDQIAQMFRAQSESVSEMLNDLKNNYSPLNEGEFIGDAANAFFADFEGNLVPALNRLTEALDQASSTTSTVRQNISDAEQEASDALKNSWMFA